jgi:nucleoside-diphosphate-sugar epimerase
MKVLVTGASGFIGRALCAHLVSHGFDAVGAIRNSPNAPVLGVDYHIVDGLGPIADWRDALAGVKTVIHCAARVHILRDHAQDPLAEFRRVNVEGTVNLAQQAIAAGTKRFIFISSIGVNGNVTVSNSFSESNQPNPRVPYAVTKWEAEQTLSRISAETGLEVVIIRPPLVYGPNAPGNFGRVFRLMQHGIPLPFASAKNRRSFIYLDNLTDAIATCLTHPAAAGKTYLVSDGEDVSTAELIARIAHALGKPSRLWPCPLGLIELAGMLTGKSDEIARLLGSLCIDSSKIRNELDWTPPYTLEQGLAEMARRLHGQNRYDRF